MRMRGGMRVVSPTNVINDINDNTKDSTCNNHTHTSNCADCCVASGTPNINNNGSNSNGKTVQFEVPASSKKPNKGKKWRKKKKSKKPANATVLLECKQTEDAFKAVPCPMCKGQLISRFPTRGIATYIDITCENHLDNRPDSTDEFPDMNTNPHCTFEHSNDDRSRTTVNDGKGDYKRNSDFALNVLFVLGFLASGDGGTEAGRMLGLLGMPNDTTMSGVTFKGVEDDIGPTTRELAQEITQENPIEEVRLSMVATKPWNEETFNKWKDSLTDDTIVLTDKEKAVIQASFDHAWQQKGSGHQYNSLSGHGGIFGLHTRKCTSLKITSKKCNECTRQLGKGIGPTTQHECWKNHHGSSGSMEPQACLDQAVSLHRDSNVIVKTLCCDDDSSIRSDCQWNVATYKAKCGKDPPDAWHTKGKHKNSWQPRGDKGKLPPDVPEPIFVADPNHRRKGLTGELIRLDQKAKSKNYTMTRNDSLRLGKNFACVLRQIHKLPESEWDNAAKAALEHHFGNHEYCKEWCQRKGKNETREQLEAKRLYCRNEEDEHDMKLHLVLKETLEKWIAHERLKDMNHELDTNINEAVNSLCAHFAPKDKIYCGSGSLHNRLSIAFGIHSIGWSKFTERLFEKLGIDHTDNVSHFFRVKENQRKKKLAKKRTKECRKNRAVKKQEKKKETADQAQKDHKRRVGHKGGLEFDLCYKEPIPGVNVPQEKPAPKKRKASTKQKQHCVYCGKSNHLTTKSQKCTEHDNDSAPKLYSREDGTSLPPAPVANVRPMVQTPELAVN